jgi:hypothetical protein
MPWVRDPDHGGVKIPPNVQDRTRRRILAHAEKHYAGRYTRIDVRFRGQFCYIDAYIEREAPSNMPPPEWGISREQYIEEVQNTPLHLCRLRYFGNEEEWSLGFYTYSHEKYELSVFANGSFYGTPEEAFEIGAVYLQD